MCFTSSIAILISATLSLAWSSIAGDYTETACEELSYKSNDTLAANIGYLRKNIKNQLSKESIDVDVFGTILRKHKLMAEADNFARDCKPRREDSFVETGSMFCVTPAFAKFGCEESFAGRSAASCCAHSGNDRECAKCILYIPCSLLQITIGWLLPCEYTDDGCCCQFSESKDLQDDMQEYLKALESIYDDAYWNKYVQ